MLINPNGFREYDARWLYEEEIDLSGVESLGKGLGTQVVNHTKKTNPIKAIRKFIAKICRDRGKLYKANLLNLFTP